MFAKLWGFGADGAPVNSKKEGSMKALSQQEREWLTFGWYVSHCLELALKDVLQFPVLADVYGTLLGLHYYHKFLPKIICPLIELMTYYDEENFSELGCKPKKKT